MSLLTFITSLGPTPRKNNPKNALRGDSFRIPQFMATSEIAAKGLNLWLYARFPEQGGFAFQPSTPVSGFQAAYVLPARPCAA